MTSLHNNVAVRQTNNSFASKQKSKEQIKRNGYFEQDLVWTNIIIYVVAHCLALWGYWRMFTGRMTWKIYAYMHIFGYLAAFGITCGVHRLWSHKAYKAKLPLRIFLMLMQTSTLQNNIYIWARDHRLHHKYTDTDADPHNSNRGFFFSHVGWLLMKKHPEVKHKGKTIDMSDVAADPVVKFQKKYYLPLALFLGLIVPTVFSRYILGESLIDSCLNTLMKNIFLLNATWSVNSVAHIWGWKPYDRTIKPAENPTVSILTWGEGWHNYHHTFPWDYKAAELGNYRMNPSTGFLDLMAYLGQAYDLKTASPEMVRKRIARTGDGLYNHGKVPLENGNAKVQETFHEDCVWGWDDKDMNDEDLKNTTIMFKGH
ncbi:(11Z)-hexadec-11-enoyl-CoA conjugase-like isoform X1 [Diabrotica virgifera virgifera]|uniref:Fatty acid desaturase domain-containing protein n=1 Tax=Diabrotica virgifera virgifera TaxID=50390 RepID=A0ABM5KF55_DIAVI|nr:(11Z)-hexadec-11-enoyl-CoA conjugase-like isoform X1 [Diabrotica virgifera virgifera]